MSVDLDLQIKTALTADEEEALNWIQRALNKAAEMEELPAVDLSLTIVDDEEIRQLNREFRNVDSPTDVLSFPLWEPDEDWVIAEEEETVPLGDLVISLPRAKEQAKEYNHSIERELGFLAVHGFLHLLGYDHETAEQEKEMFQKQEAILQAIGLTRGD
jgi:probable rRNA maturation factor